MYCIWCRWFCIWSEKRRFTHWADWHATDELINASTNRCSPEMRMQQKSSSHKVIHKPNRSPATVFTWATQDIMTTFKQLQQKGTIDTKKSPPSAAESEISQDEWILAAQCFTQFILPYARSVVNMYPSKTITEWYFAWFPCTRHGRIQFMHMYWQGLHAWGVFV